MKVVIDTNILIAIVSDKWWFRWLFDCMISGKIQICVSKEILKEYEEIIKSKANHSIAKSVLNFILISPYTERVSVFYSFSLIENDIFDNKFIDCAIIGNAEYIITNDKHFEALKSITFPKVKTLTINEFEQYRSQLN